MPTVDGDRRGTALNQRGWWSDATLHEFPDWLEVGFARESVECECYCLLRGPQNVFGATTFGLHAILGHHARPEMRRDFDEATISLSSGIL